MSLLLSAFLKRIASCSAFASSSAKSACTVHTHARSLPALGSSFISVVTAEREREREREREGKESTKLSGDES